jgi:hypothetical protein
LPTGTLVKSASASAATTSIALTSLPANLTVGQELVIAVCLRAAGTVSASDNSTQAGTANTYTKLTTPDSTNTVRLVVLACKVTRQIQTTNTITITIPSSVYAALCVSYPAYADGTIDVAPAAATGTGTAETMAATGVRAQAEEVVLGISAQAQNGTTFTAGTGFSAFTAITNANATSACIGIEDQLVANTTTLTPAATGANNAWVGGTISIKTSLHTSRDVTSVAAVSCPVTRDVTSAAAVALPAHYGVGSFAVPSSTGNFDVTGLAFVPTWVRFFGNALTTDTDTHGGQDTRLMGFLPTGGPLQACIGFDSAPGAGHANWNANDNVVVWMKGDGTTGVDAACSYVSLITGGFRLNFSLVGTRAGAVVQFDYGDDANTFVGVFQVPATTGNQTVASLPFQPGLMLFATLGSATAPPGAGSTVTPPYTAFSLGAADGVNQWATASEWDGTVGTEYQRTDRCIAVLASGTVISEASLTSVAASSFTLNWSTVGTLGPNAYVFVLILGGSGYHVGALTQRSGTGTQQVTGLGVSPVGVQFASHMLAASTSVQAGPGSGAVGDTGVYQPTAVGAMADATHRGNVANSFFWDPPATDWGWFSLNRSSAISLLGNSGSVLGRADFSAVSGASASFTLNWTTADSVARQVLYTAFGSPVSPRIISRDVTSTGAVSISGITRDVTTAAATQTPVSQSVTSLAAVLDTGITRDVTTAAAVSMSAVVTRDVTSAAAASDSGITRDVTSAAAASIAGILRSVTSAAAAQTPVSRDVTTAASVLLTPSRDVTSVAAASISGNARNVTSAASALLTPSRDVTSAAAASHVQTQDVTSAAAINVAGVTQIDVTTTAAASVAGIVRNVTSAAAPQISGITRDVTSSAAASHAQTRDVTTAAAVLLPGLTQADVTTQAAASIASITRDVGSTASALLTPARDVTTAAATTAPTGRDVSSAAASAVAVRRDVTSAAALAIAGYVRDVTSTASTNRNPSRDVTSVAAVLLRPVRDVSTAAAIISTTAPPELLPPLSLEVTRGISLAVSLAQLDLTAKAGTTLTANTGELALTAHPTAMVIQVLTELGGANVDTVYRKVGSVWEQLVLKALQADGSDMPTDGLTSLLINIRRWGGGPVVVTNDPVVYDTVSRWGTYNWGTWALADTGDFEVTLKYPYSGGTNPAIAPSQGALHLVVEPV